MSVRDMLSDGILVLEIIKEEEKSEEELNPITRKRTHTMPSNTSSGSIKYPLAHCTFHWFIAFVFSSSVSSSDSPRRRTSYGMLTVNVYGSQ